MSEAKPVVLKIGGSVITDKTGELAARTEVINRLAEEIAKAKAKNLILVHGGGSFGHPTAQKYGIKNGLKEDTQKVGFAETHHVMTVLNGLVMDALVWHEVPAVSVTPSSCITTERGRIKLFDETVSKALLKMGFTPVLYGDTTLDTQLGFTVLSGDQIVAYLAMKFGARKIILGVDVDGLCNVDPKADSNAKVYPRLTLQELKAFEGKLGKSTAADVTGGMQGKVTELIPAVEQGIPVAVVNASKPNHIYRALVGEQVGGTIIEKE